jgi:hypothetical protein
VTFEPIVLGRSFDAFSDDVDSQIGARLQDPTHDGLPRTVAVDVANEIHVELQEIGLKFREQI